VNVLLVAEESAGIQVLRAVAASEHRVVGVLTKPPTTGGGATVGSVADQLGVPTYPSEGVRDASLAAWMQGERVDLLLNVHSLYVIRPEVVAAPRIGSFNLHPGPLPELAGLNAPSWAIYLGEERHGVTVHWMAPGIDTGAIAYEDRFDLTDDDTGLSVSIACVRRGVPLVLQLLAAAAAGGAAVIPSIEQDLSRRRYFGREVPQDGRLDWTQPARRVVAFVRACDYLPFPSPWGHPRTMLGGREVAVLKASVTGEPADVAPATVGTPEDGAVRVAAGDEWVLVRRVHADGAALDAVSVL
jgi:UDP-4-amino-4-deoxy-L-arabinose formyltransferase/UDP-glucuronic acid dehydrogenase (UDP-4-keto-hexauronic acid decarboxylating)